MAFTKGEKDFTVRKMVATREFPARAKKASRLGRFFRLAALFTVVMCLALLTGFGFFIQLIAHKTDGNAAKADAIVVLTGGEARIPEAVKLLAEGRGQRLLISGVNPITTRNELAKLTPYSKKWFGCCIDVDQIARDTIGNAEETRLWAEKLEFKSLIVVTASYHMPRSLAELRRAMPDLEFIPHPVTPNNLRLDEWWAHSGTLELLAMEYIKFIPSYGRCVAIQLGRDQPILRSMSDCLNRRMI